MTGRHRLAPLTTIAVVGLGAFSFAGCGKLQGLGGPAPPLVTFTVKVTGDLAPLRPAGDNGQCQLQVALVWGAQWLAEPFCFLPPESDQAAAVIAAGCRDTFGFVPARVAADVPVTIDVPASLSLVDLPAADLLVGDVTSRVAYGSMVVYDDCSGDGTLDLALPHRTASAGRGPPDEDTTDSSDVVYGASFLTMTAPDQRVSYLEGAFNPLSAFYPRNGCADPADGFRVLGASGFSYAAGILSAASGMLPPEDPTACAQDPPADRQIDIAVQAPSTAQEAGCMERANDSSTRYRQPPFDSAPDFSDRVTACAHLPSFDAGNQSGLIQLVVSGRSQDRCKGLTHYTLRGCRTNVACAVPDWDYTASPPPWWPCPQ